MAKFNLTKRGSSQKFPVTYDVDFIGTLKPGEIGQLKKKVQKALNADKNAQEKNRLATPVFNLHFEWTKKKGKSVSYKLVVTLKRDQRFKQVQGPAEVPPKPKDPSIPPS